MIKCPFCDSWCLEFNEWYAHLAKHHDIDELIDKIMERQEKRIKPTVIKGGTT